MQRPLYAQSLCRVGSGPLGPPTSLRSVSDDTRGDDIVPSGGIHIDLLLGLNVFHHLLLLAHEFFELLCVGHGCHLPLTGGIQTLETLRWLRGLRWTRGRLARLRCMSESPSWRSGWTRWEARGAAHHVLKTSSLRNSHLAPNLPMAASAQRALSAEMEEATRALHERLMHHPFEKAISSGVFLRDDYVQYLSDFYTIFHAIETRVSACYSLQSGVWDVRLARASAIGKDLAFFAASPSAPAPSAAAHNYASYILALPESRLYLLVAHIWCAV